MLSGKTLVAFDLKARLGWTSPRLTSGRASPKRDAPGDLLFCTALPNNLPATSPESVGRFLQRFHHPRSSRRSPDDLIRAPPALDSALAPIAGPPKTTLRHLHPSGSFLKFQLILARWLIHRTLLLQSITDAFAESVRFLIGGLRFGLSQRGRRGMIRQSPIGFPQHGHVGFANSTGSDLD